MELTNCHVTFPTDADGKIVDGQWSVIIDHVWETRSPQGSVRQHQAGVRLVFDEDSKYRTDPKTCDRVKYYDYNVRGVSYCWGPDGCSAMGIPFPPNRDMRGRARWRWPATTTRTVIYETAPAYCPPVYSSSISSAPTIISAPVVTSPVITPFAPTTIYYTNP
ncbi:MAG: hypothetical protein R3B54_12205 [Bdellovibrionota bacterium]